MKIMTKILRIFSPRKRGWKEVAPGLFERMDTPKKFTVSQEVINIYEESARKRGVPEEVIAITKVLLEN